MNKLICFITGGHKYKDENVIFFKDSQKNGYILYNYCIKCGRTHYTFIDANELYGIFYKE